MCNMKALRFDWTAVQLRGFMKHTRGKQAGRGESASQINLLGWPPLVAARITIIFFFFFFTSCNSNDRARGRSRHFKHWSVRLLWPRSRKTRALLITWRDYFNDAVHLLRYQRHWQFCRNSHSREVEVKSGMIALNSEAWKRDLWWSPESIFTRHLKLINLGFAIPEKLEVIAFNFEMWVIAPFNSFRRYFEVSNVEFDPIPYESERIGSDCVYIEKKKKGSWKFFMEYKDHFCAMNFYLTNKFSGIFSQSIFENCEHTVWYCFKIPISLHLWYILITFII